MSTAIPDASRPSSQHLAAQLCRWISQQSAGGGGLTYNDDGRTTPASLYAGPLPDRALRLSTAIGIEHLTDSAGDGELLSTRMMYTLECRAATRELAGRTLAQVRRILRPGDGPIVFVPPDHGGTSDLSAVIGAPRVGMGFPLADAGGEAWRVIDIEVSGEPALADVEASGQSIDGLGSAIMTIAVEAVPDVIAQPLPVLDVWRPDADAGVGQARMQLLGVLGAPTTLRLRTRAVAGSGAWTTRDIDLSTTATIAALAHAVNSNPDGWLAEIALEYEPTVLLRAPSPVLDLEPWWCDANSYGVFNKRQLRIWA